MEEFTRTITDLDNLMGGVLSGIIAVGLAGGLIYFGVVLFRTRKEWMQKEKKK